MVSSIPLPSSQCVIVTVRYIGSRTLIGVGIFVTLVIALAVGVWGRRVYLRRYTVYNQLQVPVASTATTVTMAAPPYPTGGGYVSY